MKKIYLFPSLFFITVFGITAQTSENITIDIGTVSLNDSLIRPHMLGVIAGPAPNFLSVAPDLTSRYQDIGVTTIRNNDYQDDRLDMERMFFCGDYNLIPVPSTSYPDWSCDPNNLSFYHFTESDTQFQNWLDGGFAPFFRLGGENTHLIHRHDYKGPRDSTETNWINAGIKVVDRYNNFSGNTNTLQGYLNLWTEFPQHQFWDRDSLAFNNFWCNAFDSLRTNFPDLKIGGPGFNTSVSTALGNTAVGNVNTHINLFLRELKSRNLKPDWIGFHVFSNSIDDFYKTAIAYRRLLRAETPFSAYDSVWGSGSSSFFNNVELICDAWGFDSDTSLASSTRDSLFNKQRGAAHHTGAFIAFQQADVERAYIYRGGEFGSDTTLAIMGLFHGSTYGTYKPVAYAFKLCSNMQTTFNKKLISPVSALASGGSKIWTLAGEDVSGNKAILISNPNADTINLSLTLNGLSLSTATYPFINQYIVTDNNNGDSPLAWSGGIFVLPPYTSHLITMSNTSTGINKPVKDKKVITLFPNPSSCSITFSENLKDLKVFNVFGQLVMLQPEAVNSLAVDELENGIYFIHSANCVLKFIVFH